MEMTPGNRGSCDSWAMENQQDTCFPAAHFRHQQVWRLIQKDPMYIQNLNRPEITLEPTAKTTKKKTQTTTKKTTKKSVKKK